MKHFRAMMVVSAIASFFGTGATALSQAKDAPVTAQPRPLLVLREGGSGFYLHWDGPAQFVLYDSGLVIFRRNLPPGSTLPLERRYVAVTLSPDQQKQFLASLPLQAFSGLQDHYGSVEGPIFRVAWFGNHPKEVTVIGDLKGQLGMPDASDVPTAFLLLFDKLDRYDDTAAKPWTPVVSWALPYVHLPNDSFWGADKY